MKFKLLRQTVKREDWKVTSVELRNSRGERVGPPVTLDYPVQITRDMTHLTLEIAVEQPRALPLRRIKVP